MTFPESLEETHRGRSVALDVATALTEAPVCRPRHGGELLQCSCNERIRIASRFLSLFFSFILKLDRSAVWRVSSNTERFLFESSCKLFLMIN